MKPQTGTCSLTHAHELTDCITSYIQFSEKSIINTKEVRVFPNNKPWLTKDMKRCLNDKKTAFLRGDTEGVKNKRKELRAKIQRAKMDFKHKVEDQFCTGNPRQAWKGLNTLMGRRSKGGDDDDLLDTPSFVNDLNRFYGRFDIAHFKDKSNAICLGAHRNPTIQLSEQEVGICLSQIKPHKAPAPDGLGGRALKVCASQLKTVLTRLFQFLLNTCTVPKTWKHSIIRPVPKQTKV